MNKTLEQLSETELRAVIRNGVAAREAWAVLSEDQERVRHFREVLLPKFKAEESHVR